jgi:hypothetical protein
LKEFIARGATNYSYGLTIDVCLSWGTAINKELKQFEKKMDKQLELLLKSVKDNGAKMDGIDQKLTQLTNKFNVLERKVTLNEGSIHTLQTQQSTDSKRITFLEQQLAECKEAANSAKDSAEFMSSKYELLKDHPALLEAKNAEIVTLKQSIDNLSNNLEQQKISTNRFEQYYRDNHHVKLFNVPMQPGEEKSTSVMNDTTLDVLQHVCDAAEVDFTREHVDVCHRLRSYAESKYPPAIIIRFKGKRLRCNFYDQKDKMRNFTTSNVDFSKFESPETPPADMSIYMTDHLTKMNSDLLSSAKRQLKETYEYPGYVLKGEVRVKLNRDSRYIPINCERDIARLVNNNNV